MATSIGYAPMADTDRGISAAPVKMVGGDARLVMRITEQPVNQAKN
jgi:hypothetical protein